MTSISKKGENIPILGLDVGAFAVKGFLVDGDRVEKVSRLTAGHPTDAAVECLKDLLGSVKTSVVKLGLTGSNAKLVAEKIGISPTLEIEALEAGLSFMSISGASVLSLGHENMYYLELDNRGVVTFFNYNGQCAAGSGSFWYQQATRMGYNDWELAEVAVRAGSAVKISGRCAVFAKSDMTHAINGGASQQAVAAGMAKALVDLVVTGVAQDRIKGPGTLAVMGGVANNQAILKYLKEYCLEQDVDIVVPGDHEYINALGAAQKGVEVSLSLLTRKDLFLVEYVPENPLPPLEPGRVFYSPEIEPHNPYNLSTLYLGVDCGSVSTKCVLLDSDGRHVGGVYLPTAGRPALQVLALMKKVGEKYGYLLQSEAPVVACTTGSGRFLAQKVLNGDYAVDEITCQAEGVKSLYEDDSLAIIEIGGEDSKFIQIKNGVLFDYNMNPICAAGTGTFLENLAELLGVSIKEEFSEKALKAEYAIDLGDTCTLLSQTTLVSAISQGLPLDVQLASLAYSSARNYLSKTVENRHLEGKLVFTGATAKNHALAAAFAAECGREVFVPPYPELTGALGAALMARAFHIEEGKPEKSVGLSPLNQYSLDTKACKASCPHEHNCQLDVIRFNDGTSFIYGDRCGRYSELDKKKQDSGIPDYQMIREKVFLEAAGEPLALGTEVGIACSGLYYELYPFWAAFFRTLGARVVLSGSSNEKVLEQGKRSLAAEMCYPMEVLIGHYSELVNKAPDYIFIPEVVDLEPLPWMETWTRSMSCPLLMMARGVVVHSLNIPEERVLHAQLNFNQGPDRVKAQLLPAAKKLLGKKFSHGEYQRALDEGYRALSTFRLAIEREGRLVIEGLEAFPDAIVALILGRSYTLYDPFVSKDLMSYAAQRGLIALPQDFLLEYLRGWYEGRFSSSHLDPYREEFENYLKHKMDQMGNVYPAQLQHMLVAALAAQFLNERVGQGVLPQLHLVLQDPFRCGPNSMLRHYLDSVAGYLRLTIDEHTAPAGMITRLEAFKNTCRSRKSSVTVPFFAAKPATITDSKLKKILILNPTKHPGVFAAVFQQYGVQAILIPQSADKDMTLARRYTNGEECLPFIQNMQDYLEYVENNPEELAEEGTFLFQGGACGPCRYGFYAPVQSLLINRAGFGPHKVCSIKHEELVQRFGPEFFIGILDGLLAIDLLYKMLHRIRPYELRKGSAEALFDELCEKVYNALRHHRFLWPSVLTGSHLKPLESIMDEAARRFAAVPCRDEPLRPQIMVAGEFYVRLDERCNQDIIRQIESAGGEVSLAPATEFFLYSMYTNYRKATEMYNFKKTFSHYFSKTGHAAINWLAHRDEHRLQQAAAAMLDGLEEPVPRTIREYSLKYIPEFTAGEPPMTVGRTGALAGGDRISGAIFVGPFTCMPASVVEAQQGFLSKDTGIPIITAYYDGRNNVNRDEFISSLVFQAKQNLKAKAKSSLV